MTFDRVILMVACFLLTAMVGIGVYQHAVAFPFYLENPPASFSRINQYGKSEVRFWVPVQAATLIFLILSLIAVWGQTDLRKLILATIGCYLIVAAATAIYFAPAIIAWGKMDPNGPPLPELKSAAHRWLILSWLRQAILIVGSLLLWIGLAIYKGG